MIKKLRVKFICIILCVALVVVGGAFAYILRSTAAQEKAVTDAALSLILDQLTGEAEADAGRPPIGPGKGHHDEHTGPYEQEDDEELFSAAGVVTFWVQTNKNGDITDRGTEQVDVSDETLRSAAARALAGEGDGRLDDLSLRYRLSPFGSARFIVFADRSGEMQTLRELGKSLLLTGVCVMLAVFALSFFLSKWALRPVETAWRQQRQFVADASHELKTPLTVMLANNQILLSQPEATVASQRKWVESTAAEGDTMRRLIDDMLFLAKQDALRTPRLTERIDLSELCWAAALSMEPVAFEKGVRLETDIRPGFAVRGDAGQLRQLCMILLDNACKYAGGDKTVHVSLTEEKGSARLTVSNPGTPIPRESLPHLFERFYRADKSRARSGGGSGLGLAIAQSIVQSHRGGVAVRSDEKLTSFTVSLPLETK